MSNREKLFDFISNLTEEEAKMLIPAVKSFLYFQRKHQANNFHEVIYSIRHNVTGREYIGRTGIFPQRVRLHIQKLEKGKHIVEDMQRDFNKYGNDYTVTVLDEITERSERKREYELIESHGSYIRGKGYNYNDKCFLCWKRNKE